MEDEIWKEKYNKQTLPSIMAKEQTNLALSEYDLIDGISNYNCCFIS